jgi:hypothetical protein
MILGRMVSRLDATIFDREGYSSHKPSKEPPRWALQKSAELVLKIHSLVCFAPFGAANLLGLAQTGLTVVCSWVHSPFSFVFLHLSVSWFSDFLGPLDDGGRMAHLLVPFYLIAWAPSGSL